ncbi:succinate dehydrogenase, cytochrome b556 subunit [Sphingomonas piscis]|uniref:Succinate dehydrogenase cytochrome b556 subunit n=1 Tax=Sphingomonas piscis TaxID=2714943 RepID=A0A6G7YNW5_9SPHN|nr:succinate dehydrogenase, cytochrome b556 subunit [Sphingomonas piscis]QIK78416.1 succinate dehydrogenase, cytochrome b556 subunit [Sphingomonas piscis]
MAATKSRPLSPHLTIWRWGPHMAVSILHRVTGGALTVAGLALLVWWLMALAGGPDSYGKFVTAAKHPLGLVVLIGLTWAFFQHTLSGIRHLIMDSGNGFEIQGNKKGAVATIILSLLLTAAVWAFFLGRTA